MYIYDPTSSLSPLRLLPPPTLFSLCPLRLKNLFAIASASSDATAGVAARGGITSARDSAKI